ncbi:carbonic anhydrase [Aspergillus stella-maris]|uniref:carbonic anhydrase n=1 Tax=Aspergillus stella-maris TaxID=1810926 RepID=UPI003CCE0D0A
MASQDPILSKALSTNKRWANYTSQQDPTLFPTLSTAQHPRILWLGCSDSRCPETTLLGLQPGDVFTHRNIANIISEQDGSVNAVIEYAIVHLKIRTVFVCGHTKCGGVQAVLQNKEVKEGSSASALTPWLAPLRTLARDHRSLLKTLDLERAALALVELNVLSGVRTVLGRKVVREAVRDRGVSVHGLVYDVGCGRLREVDGSTLVNGGGKVVSSRRSVEGRNVESRAGVGRVGGGGLGGRRGSLFV